MIDQADVYLGNAAAMWTALAPDAHLDRRLLRADLRTGTRVILREPHTAEALAEVGRMSPDTALVVEDVFAGPHSVPLTPASRLLRMPVMNRPPAPLSPAAGVIEVRDPDTLAEAERVIVDGFPRKEHQPWVRGHALPPRVLDLPGWRVWLARVGDEPAAAAYTYDDGYATGVYWLATLPAHRARGLARAVMTQAVAARPDHVFTLVATEAGRPLYESLGFTTVATATWHTRPPLTGR